jgi:hypothetical protein
MSRLIPSYIEQGLRIEQLERELAEAVAAERERCAKLIEQYTGAWDDEGFALAAKIRKGE